MQNDRDTDVCWLASGSGIYVDEPSYFLDCRTCLVSGKASRDVDADLGPVAGLFDRIRQANDFAVVFDTRIDELGGIRRSG